MRVPSSAWLVDLLFPSRCVSCASSASVLCPACLESLRLPGPVTCGRCGAPTLWPVERCRECAGRRLAFRRARAAVAYSGAARDLVAAWKEHGLRRAAILAAELVVDRLDAPAADVITYIPPDRSRLLERGHHPAERLARELAGRWRIPHAGLLVRSAAMPATRQTALARADRLKNVRGAFVGVAAAPRNVLLVDDVYTSRKARWSRSKARDRGLRTSSGGPAKHTIRLSYYSSASEVAGFARTSAISPQPRLANPARLLTRSTRF